jgi:hypothetical protein
MALTRGPSKQCTPCKEHHHLHQGVEYPVIQFGVSAASSSPLGVTLKPADLANPATSATPRKKSHT